MTAFALPAPSSATFASVRVDQIYVVDDDEMVGLVVHDVLDLMGLKPVVFQDPSVALAAFEEQIIKPKLLITDFAMAPKNGMELIAACREIALDLKCILYSGYSEQEIFQGHALRPDEFLRKPFHPTELVRIVTHLLGLRP